jgi:tol-pal system protein YbgF
MMSTRYPIRRLGLLAAAMLAAAMPTVHASELEDRVTRIESLMQSQGLIDMLTQLQQLQSEVQELRGQVETQGNQLQQMQEQQRSLYLDIDRRLQGGGAGQTAVPGASMATPPVVITSGAAAPAVPASPTGDGTASAVGTSVPTTVAPAPVAPTYSAPGLPPGAATPSTVIAPTAQTDAPAPAAAITQAAVASPEEQAAYEQALNVLREGRYADAAKAYQQFLATYPNGRYVDNAQYWLAETQYVTRQFPQALEEFGKVVNNYPSSTKVPDAQLKMGYIHYEQGNWVAAREQLQSVVQRFPDSTAARLANERLQRMSREGR